MCGGGGPGECCQSNGMTAWRLISEYLAWGGGGGGSRPPPRPPPPPRSASPCRRSPRTPCRR